MVEQGNLTEDEAALYDRQIRLWGLDAQRRLRAAKVLLIGARGCGAEVAKNIVLSGIKSLTILDNSLVTEEDACSQFLIPRSDIGKKRGESSVSRTQLLNPMVEVTSDPDPCPLSEKKDEYFTKFDIVCATCCSQSDLLRINNVCAQNGVKFFAGDVFGYYGYMFTDLGEHEYAEEVKKPENKKEDKSDETGEPAAKKSKTEETEMITVKKNTTYCRLKSAFDVDWTSAPYSKRLRRTPDTYFIARVMLNFMDKFGRRPSTSSAEEDIKELESIRETTLNSIKVPVSTITEDFSRFCFAELSPVCAVVGGILGQEIIKAVSQRDKPHNNFFFYNGTNGGGLVDCIGEV